VRWSVRARRQGETAGFCLRGVGDLERRCPYCEQVLPEFRLGIRLPALKARIFDLVLRGGRDGIDLDDLWTLTYNGNAPNGHGNRGERKRATLRVHVNQINDEIKDAGYRIVCGSGAYRLENLIRLDRPLSRNRKR
jgi:hypothetical protein